MEYISRDKVLKILDDEYLLPFRKEERIRGLKGIEIDRVYICEVVDNCEDCPRYGNDCDGERSE